MKTSHLVATLLVTFKTSRTSRCSDGSPQTSHQGRSASDELLTVLALYKALGGGWKLTDEAWTGVQ
jgi:hypothetical protein